jgi:hypothetical protein
MVGIRANALMPTWVFPFSPRPHATTICSRIGGFLPHIPRQSGRCGTNGDQVGNDKRGRIKKDNSPSILLFKDEASLQRREIITGRDAYATRMTMTIVHDRTKVPVILCFIYNFSLIFTIR